METRQTHYLKTGGSSPPPATNFTLMEKIYIDFVNNAVHEAAMRLYGVILIKQGTEA